MATNPFTLGATLGAALTAFALVGAGSIVGCKMGPAGRIAHDANKTAHVGQAYTYTADGMVHTSQTPSDSFWFAACGDDAKSGFTVEREGHVAFTPTEARAYPLCVELRTAAGVDDTYRFDVTAAP